MKAANKNEMQWYKYAHSVFWVKCLTISKATGLSPYYIVHGVKPLLPFDLAEATYLLPSLDEPLMTVQLLGLCAKALQKQQEDLDHIAHLVNDAHHAYARQFAEIHRNTIMDYDFPPG